MSSPLKERGVSGGNVMASKPNKTLADTIVTGKKNSADDRRNPAALLGLPCSSLSTLRGTPSKPSDLNPKDFGPSGSCLQEKKGNCPILKPNAGKFGGKDRKSGVGSRVSVELALKSTAEMCKDKGYLIANFKSLDLKDCSIVKVSHEINKQGKNSGFIGAVENSGEKGVQAVIKNPSKFQENFVPSDNSVHRISSEIESNKEMLGQSNNQEELKLILYDIQEKIPGSENTVSSVIDGDGTKSGENLEVLIKNRIAFNSKTDSSSFGTSMGSIDENPVGLEFLASVYVDQDNPLTGNQEMDMESPASEANSKSKAMAGLQGSEEIGSKASEKNDDLGDQKNKQAMVVAGEAEESHVGQIYQIGNKVTTGGWFISDGEFALLTHNDNSCSYHDITNSEEKTVYKAPEGAPNYLFSDCWITRGSCGDEYKKYVVAASSGSTLESGFCSWDFYTKKVHAFHVEDTAPDSAENPQWWYIPCESILMSTCSKQKNVSTYDIRDGQLMMNFDVSSPVVGMEYSSPLQWRSNGKVIVAETEALSLWDVNSYAQPLKSIPTSGKRIYCLHVNNTDAEVGGGVRRRSHSSQMAGSDCVFCTEEGIHVVDFRRPSGIAHKIVRPSPNVRTIFSLGESIFIGDKDTRKHPPRSFIHQFSIRQGKLLKAIFFLPDSNNSQSQDSSITQVWGNPYFGMGINSMGLCGFKAIDESFSSDYQYTFQVNERIGPGDLYRPTFDCVGSRVLIISRDRPAMWRYL
ncbi:uncharacterized protein A4U43_C10F19340 [Asparagus officinalis]|uniref:At4g14310 8-bladed propeller domain-containing protein n=1 Tax=Asparagus officinalis TaxID=4686 RepID=A0A5P1E7D0_ASPOF|nr:KIN14B-interacting protein At4g14310-like [Asparagus officinalis]ONK57365.1 uncharacterized protein A4U43_C10F19340 [Asparagus officinalis]